jgi:hypothetical protein
MDAYVKGIRWVCYSIAGGVEPVKDLGQVDKAKVLIESALVIERHAWPE